MTDFEPRPFDLDLFLSLAPDWRGRAFYFPTIGSTNRHAREQLRNAPASQEWLFTTDKQTAGRGRLNRSWEAPFASGLLCTLTLPLGKLPLDRAYLYTASLSLSLQAAIWQEAGLAVDLKWPNDLLHNGRKCCGILAEMETGLGRSRNETWLALGFGLNTGLTPRDLADAGLSDKATNLTPPGTPPVSREHLLAAALSKLDENRARLNHNPETVRQEWAEKLITIGRTVQILDMAGNAQFSGLAIGVDASGGLRVQDTQSGQIRAVQAGDVSVRLEDGRYA